MAAQTDLIFDIGLHKGKDSAFYLKKGFRVVGLEAVPELCEQARALLKDDIGAGRMTVVNRALSYRSGERVSFFVNPDKDDWGSLERQQAEKGVGNAVEISVETISLQDLFSTYGTPHYIKCDIEGGDAIFIRSLLQTSERPRNVSFELTSIDDLAFLLACGYDEFQIVNQWLHPFVRPPNPAREGAYVDARFDHETSGLFGRELPEKAWTTYAAVVEQYSLYSRLRGLHEGLAIGWTDVHARRRGEA